MIVSEQYQVETDQHGNPVAFHKLRSIRMPNHPAPRIAYSNQPSYPSITNIHSHTNNPNNIQFMPALAPSNRTIGVAEMLLLIVVIAIAVVLVIDLSGINKKDKVTDSNQQYNQGKSSKVYEFEQEQSEWEQVIDDLQQKRKQLKNSQKEQIPHNKQNSIAHILNTNDKSGQWILQFFIEKLKQQQLRQTKTKHNPNTNIGNIIQINKFRQNLMYRSTDKQWLSFLNLGINHFNCFNKQNQKNQRYCQQLIEQWKKYTNVNDLNEINSQL